MSTNANTSQRRFKFVWLLYPADILAFLWAYPLVVNALLRESLKRGDINGSLFALRLGADPASPYDNYKTLPEDEDVTIEGETCFIHAVKLGAPRAIPIIRAMMRRGVEPGEHFDYGAEATGWDTAVYNDALPLMKVMLEEGATLSQDDIDAVVTSGTPPMLVLLESYGVSLQRSMEGQSMLHRAAETGNTKVVLYLLQRGFPINAPRQGKSSGMYGDLATPLMLAIDSGHLSTAQSLLAHGASVRSRDIYHRTVLDHAVDTRNRGYDEWSSPEKSKHFMQLLRKHGAQ